MARWACGHQPESTKLRKVRGNGTHSSTGALGYEKSCPAIKHSIEYVAEFGKAYSGADNRLRACFASAEHLDEVLRASQLR